MNEILHNAEEVLLIDRPLIDRLKRLAEASPRRRSRLCMHRASDDLTHEMIIAFHRASFMPPHRHPAHKSESYHVIEGAMDVLIFNDVGSVTQRLHLDAGGNAFAYRLSANRWHMPLPLTEWLVYHEVYTGPFVKQFDVEFPVWAPAEEDTAAVSTFLKQIL